MKIHRFYTPNIELSHNIWIHQSGLLHQWLKVLRFNIGQELVLFDGLKADKLYKITEIKKEEVNLDLVTEYHRKLPSKEIYLFWSLLKKDKNDWVLQKCTEIGVKHFIPVIADRSEKTGFRIERAQKIIIEAVEQCGRSDIPFVREPLNLENAINQYKDKVELNFAEQEVEKLESNNQKENLGKAKGIFIGPEGGWSEAELNYFNSYGIRPLNIHDFTLRAETASVVAVSKLLQ